MSKPNADGPDSSPDDGAPPPRTVCNRDSQASQDRYRSLFEAAGDAIFLMEDDRFVDCNPKTLEIFRCTRQQILTSTPDRFSPERQPDGRNSKEKVREKIAAASSGAAQFFEWRHRRFDGTPFDTEVRLSRVSIAGHSQLLAIVRDITDRKVAEQALREEKQFAEALFDSLPGAAYVFGEDGRFVRWNRSYYERQGWNAEQMATKTVLDRVAPRDRERAARLLQEAFRAGHGSAELHTVAADGRETPEYCSGVVAEIAGKRYAVGVGLDISDLKRTEQTLRESEQRYRSLFEAANDAIFLMARDRFVECNPKALAMFGCTREQMLQAPPYQFSPERQPDGSLSIKKAQERISAAYSGAAQFFEWRHCRFDGTHFDVEVSLSQVIIHGEPRLLAIVRDITDRKVMQEQIRQAADEWQATFDSVQDLVMVLDLDYRIVRANAAAVRFFGRPPEQLRGNHCHELMHGTAKPHEGCPIAEAVRTRRHQEAEIYEARHGLWILVCVDPILDETGRVKTIVHTVKDVTARKRAEQELRELKERLEAENVYLREEVLHTNEFQDVVGRSVAIQRVLDAVAQVAPTESTVLLLGETGTGKEVIARAIHARSGRSERPLVAVNCAALPSALMESELFGHEKGAFSGALTRQIGRFEVANQGTLLLDEIGELAPELQAKLLRVLQEGTFERVGSSHTIQVDVRVIAASNRDLAEAVRQGRFRADLYYRLSVFPIQIPPLRERRDDIPLLVWHFIAKKQRRLGTQIEEIPQEVMRRLQAYDWPGNVRELENVVEQALILSPRSSRVLNKHFVLQRVGGLATAGAQTLEETQRAQIVSVLKACAGRIKGPGNAAERLGLKPSTLYFRMKKLGILRGQTEPSQ